MDKDQVDKIENEIITSQKGVCKNYGSEFVASPFDKIIGVAIETLE